MDIKSSASKVSLELRKHYAFWDREIGGTCTRGPYSGSSCDGSGGGGGCGVRTDEEIDY